MLALLTAATGALAEEYPALQYGVAAMKSDIGMVLCTDGNRFTSVAIAKRLGRTPLGMIAYVDEVSGKGLAIALENVSNDPYHVEVDQSMSEYLADQYNTSHAFSQGTWRLPTIDDWKNMFVGCGSTSEDAPFSNMEANGSLSFDYGNLNSLMLALGGTDLTLENSAANPIYWTSVASERFNSPQYYWVYNFEASRFGLLHYYNGRGIVRPCLEFNIAPYYTMKIKDGTPDAELWDISPNPAPVTRAITLIYSGKRMVSGTMVEGSTQEGVYWGDRYTKWGLTMPNFNCEVAVEYDPTPILADDVDNFDALVALNGTTTDIILNAVIPRGWNIFTVPFDIEAKDLSKYAIMSVKKFVGSSYDKDTQCVKFHFEDVADIKAGIPYLIQEAMNYDLFTTFTKFEGVTVNMTPTTVCSIYANLVPTLSKTTVEGDPQTVRFLDNLTGTTYFAGLPADVRAFSGYFWLPKKMPEETAFAISFDPYVPPTPDPEPISEETEEKPGDIAKASEVVTSTGGITYSLGVDDSADPGDGSVTLQASMNSEQVMAFLKEFAPGSPELFEQLKGIYFMLGPGSGTVELEIELFDNAVLAFVQSNVLNGEYTVDGKGTLTIYYDVTEDTWFFTFPALQNSAEAPAYDKRGGDSAGGGALKIYRIRIIPDDATGIENIDLGKDSSGVIYNLNGQRVTSLQRGMYIIDGRKVVIP